VARYPLRWVAQREPLFPVKTQELVRVGTLCRETQVRTPLHAETITAYEASIRSAVKLYVEAASLGTETPDVALKYYDRFFSGVGGKVSGSQTADLADLVKRSDLYVLKVEEIKREIDSQVSSLAMLGVMNPRMIDFGPELMGGMKLDLGEADSATLKVVVDATQGARVKLEGFKFGSMGRRRLGTADRWFIL
jgi:hypothetical protein